ncbi:MAG: CARDB domain-containing protein [Patescibacteria group bacterium]
MTTFPALSKKIILAFTCVIASIIIASSILYSEHVNAQASPPYNELGCGATSIPVAINCIGGEPVLADCDASQMGYVQVNSTTKKCGGATPQWSHTDNWGYCQTDPRCTTPVACTMTNSCGQFNTGTVQSDGSCSVSAPADPAGYGSSCTTANVCGTTNSGAIQCNGSCSATAPALPPSYGTSCSVSNSCGASTNYGTIGCNGSCSASAPSEATCAVSQANLTATNTSPASGTAGSITLTGTVTNGGSAAASPSFTQYFEVQGNGTLTWTSPGITVAAGSSANVSASRSFAAGSYQVRMCADGTGAVTESNESDNCSGWNVLNVSPASGGAPSATLSASPTTITLGNSSTLTWSSSNATSCTGTGTGFSTSGSPSGNDSVTPAATGLHTYQVQCTGPGGTSPVVSANVTVNPASGGSCTGAGPIDITATPNRVQIGQGTALSWTVADAASATCTVTNQNTGALVKTTPVASCSASDSAAVSGITAQTTFRLACGALTKDVIVNIVPKFEEF